MKLTIVNANPTVLAINTGHNGSVAVVKDGKLAFHIEEERLSRRKYDSNPFLGMLYAFKKYHIDVLVVGGTYEPGNRMEWSFLEPYACFARKFNKNIVVEYMHEQHHLGHAAGAFFNSGFETAISLVVDGCGSSSRYFRNDQQFKIYETESAFHFKYPCLYKSLYTSYGTNESLVSYHNIDEEEKYLDSNLTIVKMYEAVSDYLGFEYIEGGKTMGLSSYGKYNDKFKTITNNAKLPHLTRGNPSIFKNNYPMGGYIDHNTLDILPASNNWHRDSTKVTDDQKNLAWAVQLKSQTIVGDLIEHLVKITGEKNVAISGGYGLNCVANYYYKKRFPDLNFYIEPISSDAGTSIGLAKLVWSKYSNTAVIDPCENIYTGFPESALVNFEEVGESFEIKDITYSDVARLIREKNIVCIFQGRSESGPRALGNRSILFDPTVENGKDLVNKIKGREWFRPFAGSVLEEHAEEYFDMAGLKKSPFMMYAVDVRSEKCNVIPAITHVDNTCRIQTVSKKDNEHYYNLIKAFKDLSGVPILFNTSFNLAGDPLVETFTDALDTLERSELKYLYLPEYSKLVIKK